MTNPQHLHRCYVASANWDGENLQLENGELHHLLHVLRLRDGDHVIVFDGKGRMGEATLCLPQKTTARGWHGRDLLTGGHARLLSEDTVQDRRFHVTLIQALPKGKRMDLIVEKATELGAAVIQPVTTERVVVKLDPKAEVERSERWVKIALGAARQCGTPWLPEIRPVQSYRDAIAGMGPFDLLLLGALGQEPAQMRDVLRHADGVRHVGLIIGPEGDLTTAEIEQARARAAVPVSFGSLVLRVETAAIYGLSVLSYELG